jgi:alanine racemase
MSRPIRAIIDLAALRHNFLIARQHAGRARLWAVVKANAYGHGLERTVAALEDLADGFALIEIEGALALRKAGLTKPLLLLEGCYTPEEAPLCVRHHLLPVVHRREQIDWLCAAGWPADWPVYLKINTGMNRLGFDAAGLAAARVALAQRHIPCVLMTHFADADGARGIDWQLQRFGRITAGMHETTSLGNSATILRFPESVGDWARPGIMLYGGSPFPALKSAAELGLKPVMTLESEVIAVQRLSPGESIGYGCTFTAPRPMTVGVIACGYADGYPRHAPTGTPVLVAGQRTRLLGRVSMDKLCVDLTDLKVGANDAAWLGSPVVLWGEGLPADEVAHAAGTVSYELFCGLAARVPVIVRGA